MSLECWKCHHSLDGISKITFRTVCPHCDIDLHVCVNCRYYSVGKPNDCMVPGTESIRNRDAANFCEEFAVKSPSKDTPSSEDPIAKAKKRLFGEE